MGYLYRGMAGPGSKPIERKKAVVITDDSNNACHSIYK